MADIHDHLFRRRLATWEASPFESSRRLISPPELVEYWPSVADEPWMRDDAVLKSRSGFDPVDFTECMVSNIVQKPLWGQGFPKKKVAANGSTSTSILDLRYLQAVRLRHLRPCGIYLR